MPRLLNGVPRYRRHRASGQAIVTLSGRDHYLGPHGTQTSHREYDRLVAEWLARGRSSPSEETAQRFTLVEIMAAYKRHAGQYYRKNGAVTNEYTAICSAMNVARRLYGHAPAAEFGPLKLQAVQQAMIAQGWCRKHINKQISRLIRMFRWAASQELIPGGIPAALREVRGLAKSRSAARETAPVMPVPDELVEKTIPLLPQAVADMVRLQRYTGARPEEVCLLRPADVDQSEPIWAYCPSTHKMDHKDRTRTVFLGPKAQEVLKPYLDREATAYCFSPTENETQRRLQRHRKRVVPLGYGNRPGTNRKIKPKRRAGHRYTTASYRRAITRACELAFGMPQQLRKPKNDETAEAKAARVVAASAWRKKHCWAPNQLRHTAGTAIRRLFGLEASQTVLGHSRADVTQIYAERDHQLARRVAQEIG